MVVVVSSCPAFASLIVSESRGERVHPVLLTAQPSSSSHGDSRSICVERPTPSVPSITIRWPGSEPIVTYGRPWPYQDLLRFAAAADILRVLRSRTVVALEHALHLAADHFLLGWDV